MSKMIVAGIVLYKPNFERFRDNINSLIGQINTVIIYDNDSDTQVHEFTKNVKDINIIWIGSGINVGIAKALNCIMDTAYSNGAEWVITLDQDSILPKNFVKKIEDKNITDDIAIICPLVRDERRIAFDNPLSENKKDEYIDRCITSGSCTRIKAWKVAGGFDEYLFIDLVDNDFCKRIRIAGWKIIRINEIVLNHEFGNIKPRKKEFVNYVEKIVKKIPNHNLAENITKITYKKSVSPLRIYYSNRNIIYLNKKLKKYGGIGYESYYCSHYLTYAIFYNLASIIRSDKKIDTFKAVLKGIHDGHKVKVNPIDIEKIF